MYIRERPDWPEFKYDIKSLIPSLDAARTRQSDIRGTAAALRMEDLWELIFTEVLDTSLIEGEQLNPQDVRSSVARRLGLSDLALARDEQNRTRLYSLPSQILRDKSRYYALLEETHKGDGYITGWLLWFLETYAAGIDHSLLLVRGAFQSRAYYSRLKELDLNDRQKKVLDKMIALLPGVFHGGMTNRKYTAITGTSPATAKRDLTDLAAGGVLVPGEKGGCFVFYVLNRDWMV